MQTRTRRFVAHFPAPFRLSGFEGIQAAGAYALDQQEEFDRQAEGTSAVAPSGQVAMFMYLPAVLDGRWTLCAVRVDPAEIDTAILHEVKQGSDRTDVAQRESEG